MTEKKLKNEVQAGINNEAIAFQIESEFDVLPKTTATEMMRGYADGYLTGARKGEDVWQDSLFFAGTSLAHAKAHAGLLAAAIDIDGQGWYIENQEGWEKQGFARLAVPAYVEGFRRAKSEVPEAIQAIIRSLYPAWFIEKFDELAFSDKRLRFLLEPKPLVIPFDHYTNSRAFIGGEVHYPVGYERRVFKYMKGWYFPPTMWYSDRPENDFEGYARTKAKGGSMTVEEAVQETGKHEASHLLAIDPAIKLAMRGSEHSWLSEGIAQFYGDNESTRANRISDISRLTDIREIADTDSKPINYGASLLLVMGLARRMGGSFDEIPKGMEGVVKKVAEKAKLAVERKTDKVESPLELLYLIDPTLRKPQEREELVEIMEELRKRHS